MHYGVRATRPTILPALRSSSVWAASARGRVAYALTHAYEAYRLKSWLNGYK